jgi:O-antigen/teichoic acid export membrane protein
VAFAWIAGYEDPVVVGSIGAGFGVVLQSLHLLLATPLHAELRFGRLTALQVGGQAMTIALIVVLVVADAGLVPFLWATVPVGLALVAGTAVLVRGAMALRPSLQWARVWPLLRETLPYTAAVAVNVVYFRVTLLVMSIRASALETGYFATSFRVVEVLIGIPALVIGSAFPILARAERDDDERFGYAMRRILELALVLGSWMAVCCVAGAEVAIHVLAGDAGEPAVDVLRIQGLCLLATGVGVAGGYGLLTLRRYRAMLWVSATALVGSVVATLVLVPELGAEGAALATLAGEALMAIGVLVALLRLRPDLASGLAGAVPILAVAAAAAAVALLDGLPPLAVFALANFVFVAGLVAVRRFPPEVRDLLRR